MSGTDHPLSVLVRSEMVMQKVAPCLWFDDQAEEAAKLYVATFKKAKLGPITYYGEAGAHGFWKAEGFRHDRRL
jgi:predicted 3-demethylubiquinone-9 3-methyltransferase (glyoxalase superfamily)